MVKIAVCDDEKQIVASLLPELTEVFAGLGVENEVEGFSSGDDLLMAIEAGDHYDLIFLDIVFPKGEPDGVEVGRRIRRAYRKTGRANPVSIVYISWEQLHSADLFNVRPMNLLIKPLSREKIEAVAETYIKRVILRKGWTFSCIKGRDICSLQVRGIVYMEALNRKIIIHLCDGGTVEFYGALKDVYEERLKDMDFIFVHASYAVNFDYVDGVYYNCVHIKNSQASLPISRNRKDDVREQYHRIFRRREV